MKLKFNNGKFVIMQVSDCQDLHNVRHTMLRMLEKAYGRVQPDLIVFTGDNILGNHLCDARFGNRKVIKTREGEFKRMEKAISHILSYPEKRKIPFTMIYGNHDDMNSFTKEQQAEIYKSYSMCIGLDNPVKGLDADTFNLPVYSSDGAKMLFNLWFIDSAWTDKATGKCIKAVKKETIDWYVSKSEELKEFNGGSPVPSLMFQHIALSECAQLMESCPQDAYEAVYFERENRYVRLNPKKADGIIYDPIMACNENHGQLDALKKQGDVKAIVLGHQHKNNFVGELDGIQIIQSSAASFRCYGNYLRGVRVFILDENKPEYIKTYFLTYSEICGKGIFSRLSYIWDADGMGGQKAALLGSAAALIMISTAAIAKAVGKMGGKNGKQRA